MTPAPRSSSSGAREAVDAQKRRRGLQRLWHALGYSMTGLRAGWQE
ncbi:MAG TPA: diacylglycerol kinase, partial [Comamonadaceae bacterium]|nr:diacylglycerol kinase [Comamonadaceae bacterium]